MSSEEDNENTSNEHRKEIRILDCKEILRGVKI